MIQRRVSVRTLVRRGALGGAVSLGEARGGTNGGMRSELRVHNKSSSDNKGRVPYKRAVVKSKLNRVKRIRSPAEQRMALRIVELINSGKFPQRDEILRRAVSTYRAQFTFIERNKKIRWDAHLAFKIYKNLISWGVVTEKPSSQKYANAMKK